MKTIKFTTTVQYESEGRNKGPVYAVDSVHTFEDAFADRWLNRGVAVVVAPEIAEPAPAPEATVEPAVEVPADEPKTVLEYRGRRR